MDKSCLQIPSERKVHKETDVLMVAFCSYKPTRKKITLKSKTTVTQASSLNSSRIARFWILLVKAWNHSKQVRSIWAAFLQSSSWFQFLSLLQTGKTWNVTSLSVVLSQSCLDPVEIPKHWCQRVTLVMYCCIALKLLLSLKYPWDTLACTVKLDDRQKINTLIYLGIY